MNARTQTVLYYSILVFVFVSWIFTTIRLLIFGSDSAGSAVEFAFGAIPDMMLVWCVGVAGYSLRLNGLKEFWLVKANRIFSWFFITNVLLGVVLCLYPKLILYGFRITYLSMSFFLVGYAISRQYQLAMSILKGVVNISVFFAVVGVVLYFAFPDLAKEMVEKSGHVQAEYFIPRMTSVLWTPVLFGFLMSVCCLYYLLRIARGGKYTDYLLLTFCWICLFLTVSRGPIFAFLIVYILIALYYRNLKVLYAFGSMVLGTVLLNYVILKDGVSAIWLAESAFDTFSFGENISRVERWRLSWEAFMQQPLGYGMGRGGATAFRFLIDSNIPGAPYSTDGWYVKMLCENGFYGLLTSIGMAVYFLVLLFKRIKINNDFMFVFGAGLLMLVAIHALASNTLDYHPFISFLWMILACSLNLKLVIDRK